MWNGEGGSTGCDHLAACRGSVQLTAVVWRDALAAGDAVDGGQRALGVEHALAGVGTGVGTGDGTGVGTGVGAGDLQVAMQSPGDSEPFGSSLHWPVAELQLYMTGAGVGAGAGHGGVGAGTGPPPVIGSFAPAQVTKVTLPPSSLYTSGPRSWCEQWGGASKGNMAESASGQRRDSAQCGARAPE